MAGFGLLLEALLFAAATLYPLHLSVAALQSGDKGALRTVVCFWSLAALVATAEELLPFIFWLPFYKVRRKWPSWRARSNVAASCCTQVWAVLEEARTATLVSAGAKPQPAHTVAGGQAGPHNLGGEPDYKWRRHSVRYVRPSRVE